MSVPGPNPLLDVQTHFFPGWEMWDDKWEAEFVCLKGHGRSEVEAVDHLVGLCRRFVQSAERMGFVERLPHTQAGEGGGP